MKDEKDCDYTQRVGYLFVRVVMYGFVYRVVIHTLHFTAPAVLFASLYVYLY